ncbi:probable cytochrome P450 6a14 [Anopheles ziemanni]|uniref:probable cytochrome P450 6a14 n=1 Tax=Anopheles coustani TaxID=139045 RepID=UPI0026585A8D|nr:probable cytochrome P450 6a14 [Anopheles coustani]XP_058174280.1 probable cytochrome P450 6a14 [Anopheles ziemanni]
MELLSYVLTAFVFVVSIAYLYVRSRHNFWRDRGFPYARRKPHLLQGHMENSFSTTHASYINQELYRDFKQRGEVIGGMSFFIIPALIAVDPEVVKAILVKDFNVFHDRGVFNDSKADPLSAHLFALEGHEWRVLRQKLTPTFTSGRMKQMFGTIQQVAEEFLKYMNDNCHKEIEMKDVLARFTTDVIGTCAFGIECNTLRNPDSDFRKYGNKVFEQDMVTMAKFIFASMFKDVAKKIGVKITDKGVERFFLEVVQDTVQYREKNNVQRNDFMNLLLQIKNKGKLDEVTGGSVGKGEVGMTQNELAAQVFIFFLAGFETSSTTMNFCLYELAKNPEIQDRLREEIDRAIEDNGGEVTYDVVMGIQYLDNVINETLRKYPPVESLTRVPMRDYTVPGTKYVIPKDTLVQIPVYALHHDEEFYPEPDQFNPDRFLPEEVKKRHPYVYLPFGEGPRICIGLRFGVMQAKLGLITLLRNFRFSPTSRTPSKIKFDANSFILSPDSGNYLKVDKIA